MSGGSLYFSSFDSDVFRVPFFRLTSVDAAELADELQVEKSKGPMIADAKIAAGDVAQERRLIGLGFRRVTTQVELTATIGTQWSGAQAAGFTDSLVLDATDLTAHAASFVFSRFLQDPFIPRADAVRFMETWINNSLNGRRKVVAIGRNFCTYQLRETALEIDLLSCLDRRAGIATRLLSAIRTIAANADLPAVQVVTEAENVPALRTYVLSGFVPSKATLAMHLVHGYGASE